MVCYGSCMFKKYYGLSDALLCFTLQARQHTYPSKRDDNKLSIINCYQSYYASSLTNILFENT